VAQAGRGAYSMGMFSGFDIEGRPSETRVVVAMSGGVDSSVTAALLADAGYDVVGITLQLYDHGAATHRKGACCAGRDIHDARAVAERLGIPHYVLDYESRFKEAVIDRFAESYVAGETPVPCVECNQSIKFRDLLGTARDLGAKVLATGHYVASRALPDGGRALFFGVLGLAFACLAIGASAESLRGVGRDFVCDVFSRKNLFDTGKDLLIVVALAGVAIALAMKFPALARWLE